MKIQELDIIFLSYDEPTADIHYADLCQKAPWVKRVHGVKGSDAAHKAAAELSETDWFITVDADNIVDNRFFDYEIKNKDDSIKVYSWCGYNRLNGLTYGNGGIKIWSKEFVLNMKTHEAAETENAQVDFCWENGYKNFSKVFSDIIITGSPFQAWRAGFREGVKMTLLNGCKSSPQDIKESVWWHNFHRLKVWSTVGAHEENGIYAVYGARLGTWMANCTDWNHVEVRDFEILRSIWNQYGRPYEEANGEGLVEAIIDYGEKLKINLGIQWPYFDKEQSAFLLEFYKESTNLGYTYYTRDINV
jgi:hypothetical protein